MEKKQTAVEYYRRGILQLNVYIADHKIDVSEFESVEAELFEQAKQIDKEQNELELPTDEEIEKENPFAFGSKIFGTRDADAWEIGAKWMRDKIKGGDNE
jgi:succinylglutamate desuccinylase